MPYVSITVGIFGVKYIVRDLVCRYHIDIDWRRKVTYEHSYNGKTYTYTPEQEINYLYRNMYFRNPYVQKYEEYPDAVLDVYHLRNHNEGINSYMKDNLGLEAHINGKGMKNIDLHVTQCCIALLAAALIRLQHETKENLSSVAYLI